MENNKFILDSNIYIAFYYKGDTLHEQALSLIKEVSKAEIIVPYCVIQEVTTILTYRFGKKYAKQFIDDLQSAENCLIINNNAEEEMEFFKKFPQKISFTDTSLIYLSKKHRASLITLDKQLLNLYKKS